MDLKERGLGGVDGIHLIVEFLYHHHNEDFLQGSCEHRHKPAGSIKGAGFHD
jgi:hypothetical protein